MSSFQPGRTLLDWPKDVEVLAAHLGLSRFLVAGVSGGGPHALACAGRLRNQVAACALLSSAAPFDDPAVWKGMGRGNRFVFTLARRAPALLTAVMWLGARTQRDPDHKRFVARAARLLPPADVEVLRDPEIFAILIAASQESTRKGVRGVVHEAVMFARPWGFSGADVTAPVFLWQGGKDRNVPLAAGEWLAAEISGCAAHFEPDAGHLFTLTRWHEIEDALLSKW
jgi:pimeloyl-ACP methyl ester carboxylesterase